MSDEDSGLNRFFAFASGAGTSAWGFSELVQEPVLGSMFASHEILAVIVPFSVLAYGVASIMGGLGILGPTKDAVCGTGDS